ncbi:MAG: hypothetical protein AAFX94_19795, partial [Myxococcota bacterium]
KTPEFEKYVDPVVELANALLLTIGRREPKQWRIRPDGNDYVVEFLTDSGAKEHTRGPTKTFVSVVRRLAVMARLPVYGRGESAVGKIYIRLPSGEAHRFDVFVSGHGDEVVLQGRVSNSD